MRTQILSQVPHLDRPGLVAGNKFALIRVDDAIIDRRAMVKVALKRGGSGVPDFQCAVL